MSESPLPPVPARSGGAVIQPAIDFVVACRAADPDGAYPHLGDICWLFHRCYACDDESNWRFWRDRRGQVYALGIEAGGEIISLVHPDRRGRQLDAEIRNWALAKMLARARPKGPGAEVIVDEVAYSDDPEKIARLEADGFRPLGHHYLNYRLRLAAPPPPPRLPAGFRLRHLEGEAEAAERALLQRDSFRPYSSPSDEIATARQLRAMRTPGYDPTLDLLIVASDGVLAAGCICWYDAANKVGLFEPLGTRPAYRRRGLATQLIAAGLEALYQRGARTVLITAVHAGSVDYPTEFTVARFLYEAAGFRLLRRMIPYSKSVII